MHKLSACVFIDIASLLQDIAINCKSIVETKCWIHGKNASVATTGSIIDLDALVTYRILCQVKNDRGLRSTPRSVDVRTGELGKQKSSELK